MKHKSKITWIALGGLTWLSHLLLASHPDWAERFYARGLFVGIRALMDTLLSWSPIPLVYILFVVLVFILIIKCKKFIKNKNNNNSFLQKTISITLSLLAFCSGVYFLFMLMWGFNYTRISFETQIHISVKPPSADAVKAEAIRATAALLEARRAFVQNDSLAISESIFPENQEDILRTSLVSLLKMWNFPTYGRIRGRRIAPKGLLSGLGASGVYIPFVGEGHVDAAIHPLRLPPVLAHEMAHAYGFTDEGVCNFLGFLACEKSQNPSLVYAGRLDYWRHAAWLLKQNDKAAFQEMYTQLSFGILADLKILKENRLQYQAWAPKISRAIYDSYLKKQGVKEGIKSYDRVVELVIGYYGE